MGERTPEERFDFSTLERLVPGAPPPKERKPLAPRLLGGLAFLAAAAVVVAVPWFLLTRAPAPGPLPPSPTPSPTPSPSPSPSPPPAAGAYEVTGLTTGCLRVHARPALGSEVIDCLSSGVRVTSDGKTREADGYRWLHIHDPIARVDGWAADEYLKRVT